jgi:hypothetical protein
MSINLFDVIKNYKGLPHQFKAVQEALLIVEK